MPLTVGTVHLRVELKLTTCSFGKVYKSSTNCHKLHIQIVS